MARTKTDLNNIEQLTVRFPRDVLAALRKSAQDNDRSLNAEIVNAVRSRVKAHQAKKEEYAHAGSNAD
jgi:hypothetical protein